MQSCHFRFSEALWNPNNAYMRQMRYAWINIIFYYLHAKFTDISCLIFAKDMIKK